MANFLLKLSWYIHMVGQHDLADFDNLRLSVSQDPVRWRYSVLLSLLLFLEINPVNRVYGTLFGGFI